MTLDELDDLCIKSFKSSATRAQLMSGLRSLISDVCDAGLNGRAWVNGSFVTGKVDPADVDLVFIFDESVALSADHRQKSFLMDLALSAFKDSHWSHTFVEVLLHPGHPMFLNNQKKLEYWRNQWGFDRNKAPKGFVEVAF